MKTIILKPVKTSTEDFDELEARIIAILRKVIYQPLMRELGAHSRTLQNSDEDVIAAIQKGRIVFNQGLFTGKFTARVSKELKLLGAKWDTKAKGFRISKGSLPDAISVAVDLSEARFLKVLGNIDAKLAQILPEKIASMLKPSELFDRTLFRTERDFKESVKDVTVAPTLTDQDRKTIADGWSENMERTIKGWTEEKIADLRKKVHAHTLTGNRWENLAKTIQKDYGVSADKAKFLARQETHLMLAKFKESRYKSIGVNEYIWTTVAGSALHPVRPDHKVLAGKTFRFDAPPITDTKTGARNNPGEDFNCRCFARPVVRF